MLTLVSYSFLQGYWWVIISLLGALLVFLMFVQGGQSMIFSISSDEMQKTMVVNALGHKWEFTFTTLVTFGGAFFASFPLFYASSFGGAYWLWTAILFSFTIQAIAYEYRSKPANVLGKKTFDIFLLINGIFGPFLIGAAVATFFTGSQFSLNDLNHVKWANNWHGLEVLTDARNLALGLAVFFLVRSNASMYIINSVKDEDLAIKANRKLMVNAVVFLVFFLFFMVSILLSEGFAVDGNGKVTLEKYKYFQNFVQMPLVLVLFLVGVAGVLTGIIITIFRRSRRGIWYSGPGTILAVFSLFLIAGFNGTAFYPSAYDPGSSLTIRNASSSHFTLRTMMYVSFIIPFVFWYIWYAWKSISRKKISEESLNEESHLY